MAPLRRRPSPPRRLLPAIAAAAAVAVSLSARHLPPGAGPAAAVVTVDAFQILAPLAVPGGSHRVSGFSAAQGTQHPGRASSLLRSTKSPQAEKDAVGGEKNDDNKKHAAQAQARAGHPAHAMLEHKMEADLHSFLESTDPAASVDPRLKEKSAPGPSATNGEAKAKEEVATLVDDSDFVFVAGRSGNPSPGLSFAEKDLYRDPSLRIVSSELPIWEHLRNKDDMFGAVEDPGGLPLNLLLERTWDTAEDIYCHLRRIPYERGLTQLSELEELTRKTVVVLGSGWAAHALMKVADTNKLRLIVVSPSNHFVFTPMLASAAVGTVEYRSMTEAVRAANPMIDQYLEGKAVGLDVKKQTVDVQMNGLLEDFHFDEGDPPFLTIPYDHLVVSVGSRVDDRGVPGADRALRLKSTDDARRLREAIGECCEYASRPDVKGNDERSRIERSRRVTFLIVGGGPTGVELAGELHDLFEDVTRPHKGTYPNLAGSVRVILAHGGPALVPQFDDNLRSEALASLQKKGVEVVLNARVTEVGEGFARLSTRVIDPTTNLPTDDHAREESVLPVGLTVWCAGTAPVPFVEDLLGQLAPEARYDDGRVKVDKWMRPPMIDPEVQRGSVLVLGDAAACEERRGKGELLPATAQVAGQQGAYVARLLSRGYDLALPHPRLPCDDDEDDEEILEDTTCDVFYDPAMNEWLRFRGLDRAPPFGFLNLGMLAYLGGGEALSQVQIGDFPVLAWAGSVAFILWRSVYLVKQVATRNRMLVTFDWIKSVLFGRDMTRL